MLAFETELHRVEAVAFSPCGRFVAGGLGVELWDVGLKRVWRWGPEAVGEVAFGRSGESVYALSHWGLTRYETRNGGLLAFPQFDHPNQWGTRYHSLAISPSDGRILAGVWSSLVCWRQSSVADNELVLLWRTPVASSECASQLTFLPDGQVIRHQAVSTLAKPAFVIRSPADGSIVREVPSRIHQLHTLRVSPDGRYLAATRDNTVRVWSVEHLHRPPRVLTNDTKKAITDFAFHPGGRHLATASNDRGVTLWDLDTWQPLKTFDWHEGRMRSLAFSPDGCVAAAGSDSGFVVLFDVEV